MRTFTVYLARTGERRETSAQNWRSALRGTGQPDACLAEPQAAGAIDVTFNPDAPTIITTRRPKGTTAEQLAFAFACVVNHLDSEETATSRAIHSGGWISATDIAHDNQRRRNALRQLYKDSRA